MCDTAKWHNAYYYTVVKKGIVDGNVCVHCVNNIIKVIKKMYILVVKIGYCSLNYSFVL